MKVDNNANFTQNSEIDSPSLKKQKKKKNYVDDRIGPKTEAHRVFVCFVIVD